MKFYEVVSEFFDSGKTTAHIYVVDADKKPESTFESFKRCDIYKDYFDSYAEADQHRIDTLNAKSRAEIGAVTWHSHKSVAKK